MPGAPAKPLLLVDVDGPVNPTTLRVRKGDEESAAYVVHEMRPRGYEELSPEEFARQMAERRMQRMSGLKTEGKPGDPLRVRISTLHATEFARLCEVFEVVWATTWLEEANTFLSPLLGLPEDLPWVPFTAEELANKNRPQVGRRNGSWKTPIIARWLDEHHPGRAWAWVDDEVNQRDRTWFRDHHYGLTANPPAHLLLRVDDHRGLRSDDFIGLREFATRAAAAAGQATAAP
jgi:hypothetical protein